MPKYIAFLRGINVGGHRITMGRLRELFEALKLKDVSTFIASGNVIFSTDSSDRDALSSAIEHHLARQLGYDVATFLRTPAQLAAIAAFAETLPEAEGQDPVSTYVMFLRSPAPKSLRSELSGLSSDMDAFRFSKTEIYWIIQGKMSESPLFGGELERATRQVPATMRNMNTVRRLVAKT